MYFFLIFFDDLSTTVALFIRRVKMPDLVFQWADQMPAIKTIKVEKTFLNFLIFFKVYLEHFLWGHVINTQKIYFRFG